MKKVISLVLSILLIFMIGATAFAEKTSNTEAEPYKLDVQEFDLDSKSALLMEAETGAVLYAKNPKEAYSPASVTKIMTILLVSEAIAANLISPKDEVVISSNAASMGGSQVFLEEGERFTVDELLKCTIIASANDAAVALAETVAGTEENFVRKMNEKAKALGMENTCFENCTGLDDTTTNHVCSALDIAIMSRELLKYDFVIKYSSLWQDSIRDGEFVLTNTNRLVRYYDGCNGLKTGSTDKAGFCISTTAVRNGMQIISVVMGAPTRDIRNTISRQLLDYGFANFCLYSDASYTVGKLPVYSGVRDFVEISSAPFSVVLNKADAAKVEKNVILPEYIIAPIKDGTNIGTIEYSVDGKQIGKTPLMTKSECGKIGVWSLFKRILNSTFAPSSKNEE